MRDFIQHRLQSSLNTGQETLGLILGYLATKVLFFDRRLDRFGFKLTNMESGGQVSAEATACQYPFYLLHWEPTVEEIGSVQRNPISKQSKLLTEFHSLFQCSLALQDSSYNYAQLPPDHRNCW